MYDVFSVADRIIVMRRGVKVGERLVSATSSEEIVSLIVGAETVDRKQAMRIFSRTFYSFLGAIVLHALLVILLVSGSIKKSQEQDVRDELKAEALNVYDNFNSWKRVLWGTIVDLSRSEELKQILESQN